MAADNDPWQQNTPNPGPRFPVGLVLWVGLVVAVGLGIWFLDDLYPGRLSSQDNSTLEIVRLVGLLALVSTGIIFIRQIRLGEVVRNLAIWTALAALVVVALSFRAELEAVYTRVSGELLPSQAIALSDDELVISASADGHFYVDGRANGQRIRFMIDTGASGVAISPHDAARIGIDLSRLRFVQQFQTANGVGLGAPYRLDSLTIGTFEFADMPVSINSAEMGMSLLGMAVLERLSSFEVRDGKLYLRR